MQNRPDLYLDSAKLDEVRMAHATGKLAGLTINPSLAIKAIGPEGNYAAHVEKIFDIVGPECHKSYQVVGKTQEEMVRAAHRLVEAFGQYGGLGIKVPVFTASHSEEHLAREGLKTVRQLAEEGILVNVTTVQRPEHIVLAAYCGAGLISPFLGRTDDYIQAEKLHLKPIDEKTGEGDFRKSDYFPAKGRAVDDNYGNVSGVHMMARGAYALSLLRGIGVKHNARLLAASARNADQCAEAGRFWADIITSPVDVFGIIMKDEFQWPEKATTDDMEQMWPGFLRDITREAVERWLEIYDSGTPEEVYQLLVHPKTAEGFQGFEKDGHALRTFMELVS